MLKCYMEQNRMDRILPLTVISMRCEFFWIFAFCSFCLWERTGYIFRSTWKYCYENVVLVIICDYAVFYILHKRTLYLNLNEHWFMLMLLTWGEDFDLVMETKAAVNFSTLCGPNLSFGGKKTSLIPEVCRQST